MNIGSVIKKYRKESGFTQEEMAKYPVVFSRKSDRHWNYGTYSENGKNVFWRRLWKNLSMGSKYHQ